MVTPPINTPEVRFDLYKLVGESAGTLAIASVLVFAWGFAADSATYFYRGVPHELIPRLPLYEYMMDGGSIGLLLFVFPLLLLDLAARVIERQRAQRFGWRDLVRNLTSRRLVVGIAGVLFASVLLVGSTAQTLVQYSERARVVNVRLVNGQSARQYGCLMLAAHTEGKYVLVDRFARDAKVYVINSSEVAELQLESWAPP